MEDLQGQFPMPKDDEYEFDSLFTPLLPLIMFSYTTLLVIYQLSHVPRSGLLSYLRSSSTSSAGISMLLQDRITAAFPPQVPGPLLMMMKMLDVLFVQQGSSLRSRFVSWFVSQFIRMLEMSGKDPMMLQQTILYSLFTGTFQYLDIFKWSSSNICPFSMSLQQAD